MRTSEETIDWTIHCTCRVWPRVDRERLASIVLATTWSLQASAVRVSSKCFEMPNLFPSAKLWVKLNLGQAFESRSTSPNATVLSPYRFASRLVGYSLTRHIPPITFPQRLRGSASFCPAAGSTKVKSIFLHETRCRWRRPVVWCLHSFQPQGVDPGVPR